jgi:Zn-dependent membrane protease YugP
MNIRIGLFFLLLSYIVGQILRMKLKKYASTSFSNSFSGEQIAKQILKENGIDDVRVTVGQGYLTDNYDPSNKTVTLSKEIYEGRNIAAAAIAAHECGHAIQHAVGYKFLKLRSAMVPSLQFTANYLSLIIFSGIVLLRFTYIPLFIGICLYSLITIFSFVTLPVELDASNRALKWIEKQPFITTKDYNLAKSALKWAAFTYVIAALASLAELLHLIGIFNSRRD